MIELSRRLQWFWRFYAAAAIAFLLWATGPHLELWLSPIRADRAPTDIRRTPSGMLGWTLNTEKHRAPEFLDVDVFLTTANDRYSITLYNDLSAADEPQCTRVAPWSRGQAHGPGERALHLCVEIPRGVGAREHVKVNATALYRGFAGLWSLPVAMPDVADP